MSSKIPGSICSRLPAWDYLPLWLRLTCLRLGPVLRNQSGRVQPYIQISMHGRLSQWRLQDLSLQYPEERQGRLQAPSMQIMYLPEFARFVKGTKTPQASGLYWKVLNPERSLPLQEWSSKSEYSKMFEIFLCRDLYGHHDQSLYPLLCMRARGGGGGGGGGGGWNIPITHTSICPW